MTSQAENNSSDLKLSYLQKKFSEERKAHEETILQLLSAQAHAQTAESEAVKAQKLVAETTLKLDQAREEIKGLRDQAQDAQEAQAKIKDLEAQIAQIKVHEQSQAAIEAQAQELQAAKDKIANLEARMVKARAVFADLDVDTTFESRDQSEELKAAQTKIENLEAQVAQVKIFEQYQAQAQELKAAQKKIAELEAHTQELSVAQAQVKDLESQVAQCQKEVRSMEAFAAAQTQELLAAQERIKELEAKTQSESKAPFEVPTRTSWGQPQDLNLKVISNCLLADCLNLDSAPWFGLNYLQCFQGRKLGLGKSGLKAKDMEHFLDSWLAGSHPNLVTIILDDFQWQPMIFEKFGPISVRRYNNGEPYHSSTFNLKRSSDGRSACVKITQNSFNFIV